MKNKLQDRFENFKRDKVATPSDNQIASIDPDSGLSSKPSSAINQGAQPLSTGQQSKGDQQSLKTKEPKIKMAKRVYHRR